MNMNACVTYEYARVCHLWIYVSMHISHMNCMCVWRIHMNMNTCITLESKDKCIWGGGGGGGSASSGHVGGHREGGGGRGGRGREAGIKDETSARRRKNTAATIIGKQPFTPRRCCQPHPPCSAHGKRSRGSVRLCSSLCALRRKTRGVCWNKKIEGKKWRKSELAAECMELMCKDCASAAACVCCACVCCAARCAAVAGRK